MAPPAASATLPRTKAPGKRGSRSNKAAAANGRNARNARALANARAAHTATTTAPRTRPAAPRRRSGPVAAPRRQQIALGRLAQRRGAVLLDSLLRGRGWVALVGVLLAGIVFLNVSVLELNRGIARTDAQSATLERANSGLRARVARLDSAERIQQVAEQHGFYLPAPGDIGYLRPRARDARAAARNIVPPGGQGQSAQATTAAGQASGPAVTQPQSTAVTQSQQQSAPPAQAQQPAASAITPQATVAKP